MTQDERPCILLFGSDGQVGWELQRSLATLGDVIATSVADGFGPAVDLTDLDAVAALVRETAPQAIVNAAAYTAVDRAESDQQTALAVNGTASGVLAELAKEQNAYLIHYSTDFVFSGKTTEPYREDDPADPINVYGKTKLAGEQAVLAVDSAALIFRTSWVYGLRGHNFLLTMQRLFRERDKVSVVDDQIGSPTWSRMLAEVTAQVLAEALHHRLDLHALRGLYHLTAAGSTSWYGFARVILEHSSQKCQLFPISTSEYPAPATRPAYSVLDNSKIRDLLGFSLPHWQYSLLQCLQDQQYR